MSILDELDQILDGQVHSIFFGRSAATSKVFEGDRKRFATITKGAGETVGRGWGPTSEAALRDAVRDMRGGSETVTRPVNPEAPTLPGLEMRMPG